MKSNHKNQALAFLLVALISVMVIFPDLSLAAGPTSASGDITSDTTWTFGNSPYLVIGDITVRNGATLTIEPGVTVKFYSPTRLNIGTSSESGMLVAKGTSSSPISFTSASDNPAPGNWWGIFFSHLSNEASGIENSIIEYSSNGIRIDNRNLTIGKNIFRNNGMAVSAINNASVMIENNTFSSNGSPFGISVGEAFATISNNKFSSTGIAASTRSTTTLSDNDLVSSRISVGWFATTTIKNNNIEKGEIEVTYSSAEINNNILSDSSIKASAYFFTARSNKITGGAVQVVAGVTSFTNNDALNAPCSISAGSSANLNANLIVGGGLVFANSGYSPATVTNNVIIGGDRGVRIRQGSSSPTLVVNNTIVNQTESSIYLESPNVTATNNLISAGKYGIFMPSRTVPAPAVSFNDIFGTPTPYFNVDRGNSDISVEPLFVGSGDYHLRADSPCVDAGTSSNAPVNDYDGDARPYPSGGKVDIGADEYTPAGVRRSTSIGAAPVAGPAPSGGTGEILGRVVNEAWQTIPGTAVRINNVVIPTNPGGEFRFTLVQPGIYTVYYDAPGYIGQTQIIEVTAGVATRPPTVIMSRLGEIVGRVVSGAKLTIPGTAVRVNNSIVPTNPGGEFRFTLVHPGIYTIYYDAPGYRGQTQVIEVRAGQVTRCPTVVMDPGSTPSTQGEIYGRVMNQSQQPIALAAVRINNIVLPTNAFGEFRFSLVNPGIYTIFYDSLGYVGQTQVVEVRAGTVTVPPTVIMGL